MRKVPALGGRPVPAQLVGGHIPITVCRYMAPVLVTAFTRPHSEHWPRRVALGIVTPQIVYVQIVYVESRFVRRPVNAIADSGRRVEPFPYVIQHAFRN
jgi:hypothetical protein